LLQAGTLCCALRELALLPHTADACNHDSSSSRP
jgi:hypothetical protein